MCKKAQFENWLLIQPQRSGIEPYLEPQGLGKRGCARKVSSAAYYRCIPNWFEAINC